MPGLYTGAVGLWGGFPGLLYGSTSLSTPPGLLADAAGFSPASLFAAGEQGVWYDPSDFSTMFQDSAGTTPVTAVEQPVGRILDKSGRGNHATQATSAARPVLSARVNQLLATDTLSTQNVTTLVAIYTLAFSGTGTVTASGTNIGVYTAGSNSLVCTAGTLTLTVVGSVTFADLRVTNDGVGIPAYQRVTTSTDYDTTGFPYYLRFDGTDDWLRSTFTIAQPFQRISGIRLLPGFGFNQQQFGGGTANVCLFAVSGTPLQMGLFSGAILNGPITPLNTTYVFTELFNGASSSIQSNNNTAATGNAGAGVPGGITIAASFDAGSRTPTQLYSVVMIGRALTAAELTNTKTYVAGKTAVAL
jgi:hypothetical protein